MTRLPSERTPYNISDTIATPIPNQFKAYGTDYSEIGDNIIYFSSIPLERTVAFKAFFESIKINFQKEVDELKKAQQNFVIVSEKHTQLSYDIVLNLPAHSVNESRNNLAKIEELQRLILPGRWNFQQYLSPDFVGPVPPEVTLHLQGASQRTLETNPIFSVLFKNIINSGFPHKGGYNNLSFEDILKLGFVCSIDSVEYSPDQTAGYFEYDGYLFPKNYKLSLKLEYETSTNVFIHRRFRTIQPLDLRGVYNDFDTSLFPFHSYLKCSLPFEDEPTNRAWLISESFEKKPYLTMKKANDITGRFAEPKNTYIFISLPGSKDTASGMTGDNLNYVLFKPFITDFKRLVQTEIEKTQGANQSIINRTIAGGISRKPPEFSISFDVVSVNLAEAKRNAAKIQYLCRMFLKKIPDPFDDTAPSAAEIGITDSSLQQNLCFYIPSMIEKPHTKKTSFPTTIPSEMLEKSVELFLQDFSFDIDITSGFFESDGKIFPKAYKVSLKMKNAEADLINTYYVTGEIENEFVRVVPPASSRLDNTNAHLFAFSRQTVKIGGR